MLDKGKILSLFGHLLWVAGVLLLFSACTSEEPSFTDDDFEGFERPEHFPTPVYKFGNNEVTEEGFKLGRKLFYDPILSATGTVSCGSCHFQEAGFSDPGKALSNGINGKKGMRNAPALSNLAWFPAFMADGGIGHIEVMPIAPITDSLEMGAPLKDVLAKLNNDVSYKALFKKAFDVDSISSQKLLYALTQFMSMMISAESKFDQHLLGNATFTKSEANGYNLFKQNCASCHSGVLTTNFEYKNNGLDMISEDLGRARITQDEADRGKFKVPSLRNVELSYPYMHDGRFNTLEEVLDHYNEGIQPTPNLAEELKQPVVLSDQDKQDLLNFLYTLTDYNYITNKTFAPEGE